MQHEVGRDDVVVDFGAALRIDRACHVGKFMQQVETIESKGQISVQNAALEAKVPNEVVGVELRVGVASPTKYGEVRAQPHFTWQGEACSQSVTVVPCANLLEVAALASHMIVTALHFCTQVPTSLRIVDRKSFTEIKTADGAQLMCGAADHVGHIDIVVVRERGLVAPIESFVRTKLSIGAESAVGAPVAVYIDWARHIASRGRIVGAFCGLRVGSTLVGQIQVVEFPMLFQRVHCERKVLCGAWLQVGISPLDVEWIGTVLQFEGIDKVGHCA